MCHAGAGDDTVVNEYRTNKITAHLVSNDPTVLNKCLHSLNLKKKKKKKGARFKSRVLPSSVRHNFVKSVKYVNIQHTKQSPTKSKHPLRGPRNRRMNSHPKFHMEKQKLTDVWPVFTTMTQNFSANNNTASCQKHCGTASKDATCRHTGSHHYNTLAEF